MPKNFFLSLLLVLSLVLAYPLFGLAADVNFTEDVNLTVGGYTLVIESASRATSITVETSTVSIALADNSWFKLKSSDRRYLTNSLVNTSCESNQSSVTFSGVSAQTVVITPSASICPIVSTTGGGSSSSSSSSTSSTTTTTVTTPTTTNGQVTATAAGGGKTTFNTSSSVNAEVTLPANAVSTDTTITVASVASADAPAVLSGYSAAGNQFFSISATAGGASVTSFSKSVTLVFSYPASTISSINEDSLKIYRWTGSSWQALGSVVDKTNRKVTATTSNFSYFALFGTTITSSSTSSSTTSSTTSTTTATLSPASTSNKVGYTLMKGSGADVWVVQNGLKTLVRSLDVFNSSGYGSASIKTVSNTSLNAVATASLIKAADNPDVYILANNFKRKLASIEIFNSYKLDWSKISTLSNAVMNSFSYGPIYKHGVDLLWRDANNVLHKFASMTAFANNGYNTRDLITINDSEYGSFAIGEMITK